MKTKKIKEQAKKPENRKYEEVGNKIKNCP
jgi:hypothetical protein